MYKSNWNWRFSALNLRLSRIGALERFIYSKSFHHTLRKRGKRSDVDVDYSVCVSIIAYLPTLLIAPKQTSDNNARILFLPRFGFISNVFRGRQNLGRLINKSSPSLSIKFEQIHHRLLLRIMVIIAEQSICTGMSWISELKIELAEYLHLSPIMENEEIKGNLWIAYILAFFKNYDFRKTIRKLKCFLIYS